MSEVYVSIKAPAVNVGFGEQIARDYVERDPYTGSYTVSPSDQVQTLETEGLWMTDDLTINPVEGGSATTPTGGITANPTISVDANGKITATVSKSESITPIVVPGYVGEGTAGTITFSGSATKQLDTQAAATITPTTSQQTAVAAGKFTTGAVKVDPIPPQYIVPTGTKNITANGTHDVTQYASASVSVTPSLQNKTVTPNTSTQSVQADNGYDGLDTVTVNPIPSQYIIPSGTKSINANGAGIDVTEYAAVDVAVPIPTPTLETVTKTYTPTTSAQTETITPSTGYDGIGEVDVTVNAFPAASYTLGVNESVETVGGVSCQRIRPKINVATPGNIPWGDHIGDGGVAYPIVAAQTVTPTTSAQTVGANGSYMSGAITVAGDANLLAANIKKDVSIFSVVGTYEGGGGGYTTGTIVQRPDATLVKRWSADRKVVADDHKTLPAYSTNAQTLVAAANLESCTIDPASGYCYFILYRGVIYPIYNTNVQVQGRQEYTVAVYSCEQIYNPANTFPSLNGSGIYVASAPAATLATNAAHYRHIYWNSTTNMSIYNAGQYGATISFAAPTVSTTTITPTSPTIGVRGQNTYMKQSVYETITDIRYQYFIEVWKVARPSMSLNGFLYNDIDVRLANDLGGATHTIT